MSDLDVPTAPVAAATPHLPMSRRFRGFLPVVIDVECGGFNCATDALLEIAAIPLDLDADGQLALGRSVHAHVEPAPGTQIDPQSLEVTGIDIVQAQIRIAEGATLAEARARAYALAEAVDWPDGFYRRDIGWRAL